MKKSPSVGKNGRTALFAGLIAVVFTAVCLQSHAFFYGDSNLDGKVNSADARKILNNCFLFPDHSAEGNSAIPSFR